MTRPRNMQSFISAGTSCFERETFNGQHYVQAIDLADKELLRRFSAGSDGEAVNKYWSEENGEIKYQIGDGCEIDQVVADWHAGLIGLGNIFEPDHRKKALKSIYKLNFKSSARSEQPLPHIRVQRRKRRDDMRMGRKCQKASDTHPLL